MRQQIFEPIYDYHPCSLFIWLQGSLAAGVESVSDWLKRPNCHDDCAYTYLQTVSLRMSAPRQLGYESYFARSGFGEHFEELNRFGGFAR